MSRFQSVRTALTHPEPVGTRSNPLPLRHGRICTDHHETINSGRHRIHAGGAYDSYLLLPAIAGARKGA